MHTTKTTILDRPSLLRLRPTTTTIYLFFLISRRDHLEQNELLKYRKISPPTRCRIYDVITTHAQCHNTLIHFFSKEKKKKYIHTLIHKQTFYEKTKQVPAQKYNFN